MENLQEAVANAGYETAGYAGYYSSGFGGYGTGMTTDHFAVLNPIMHSMDQTQCRVIHGQMADCIFVIMLRTLLTSTMMAFRRAFDMYGRA